MRQFRDFAGEPQLPYHAWRALLYANYGRYNPEGIEPAAFVGRVRPLSTNGLTAVDMDATPPGSSGHNETSGSTASSITPFYFRWPDARRFLRTTESLESPPTMWCSLIQHGQ
jgi:hypothetical protein